MNCPNCGNEIKNGKQICDKCGFSLFGPKMVDLDDPSKNTNSTQSNNIFSITGINIDDVKNNTYSIPNPSGKNKKDKNKKEKNPNSFYKITIIVLVIVIVVLVILLGLIYKKFKTNNNISSGDDCPKCSDKIINETIGYTDIFTFTLPDGYSYTFNKDLVINDENNTIIVYPLTNGKIDKVTSEFIKGQYSNVETSAVTVQEKILNNKKLMFINFVNQNTFYIDFYYQYDSSKIIYGQIISSKNINNSDEKLLSIIGSFQLSKKVDNSYDKQYSTEYDNILESFK